MASDTKTNPSAGISFCGVDSTAVSLCQPSHDNGHSKRGVGRPNMMQQAMGGQQLFSQGGEIISTLSIRVYFFFAHLQLLCFFGRTEPSNIAGGHIAGGGII